jgi:hypothetical protein
MKTLRGFLIAIIVVSLLSSIPIAVEAAVIQFYFIPVLEVGNSRGPDYLFGSVNPTGLQVQWSCKDYGSLSSALICAVNAEQVDHDFLAAQAGVYQWPANLDENLPQAERSAVTSYLEAQFVPANWISPSDTRRTALRTVTGMYLFMQRLTALSGESPLTWGITLNTQYRNLSSQQQTWLQDAATTLGYPWNVAANDTIRIILKEMADEWGVQPIHFGFVTL